MIISNKNRFIFVHVPKNAGQSITNALLPYSLSNSQNATSSLLGIKNYIKINTKLKKHFNFNLYSHNFSDHASANIIRASIGARYDDYFKFAFVRNPWSWVYSNYTYAIKNNRHHRHQFIKKSGFSFSDYVEWLCLDKKKRTLQREFIYDKNTLLVDFVGRFENLKEDFQYVCEKLSINESLSHQNQSANSSYREHYSNETRLLIEKYYRLDIETFEYEF
tara:strand:+ start:617 stop:1276 length:660 start_codon:yes stop_codon:yes gene_type:complete